MTQGRSAAGGEWIRGRARRRLAVACGVLGLGGLVAPTVLPVAAAGAASTSSLSRYLLKSDEMPGYTVAGRAMTYTTASGLLQGGSISRTQRKNAVTALQKAGFVKAVEESATGANTNEGFSVVMQFASPAGAQQGAAVFLHLAKVGQSGAKPFSVAGVPSASGVTVNGSAGGSANAYWSAGSCAFGAGIYDSTAISAKAAASPVQAGIRSQTKRVGATCPG